MRRRTKVLIAASISVLVLSTTYWQPTEHATKATSSETTEADYYFKTVKLKEFSLEGSLISQLEAETMQHYNSTESSHIDLPIVKFANQDNSNWVLTAQSGILDHTTDTLELSKQVLVQLDNRENTSQIKTQKMLLDLTGKIATSEHTIEVNSQSSQTRATGFRADFNAQTFELKKNVETRGVSDDS